MKIVERLKNSDRCGVYKGSCSMGHPTNHPFTRTVWLRLGRNMFQFTVKRHRLTEVGGRLVPVPYICGKCYGIE